LINYSLDAAAVLPRTAAFKKIGLCKINKDVVETGYFAAEGVGPLVK